MVPRAFRDDQKSGRGEGLEDQARHKQCEAGTPFVLSPSTQKSDERCGQPPPNGTCEKNLLHVPDGPQSDVTVNSWLDYLRVLDILSKSRVETASDSMRIAEGIVARTKPLRP